MQCWTKRAAAAGLAAISLGFIAPAAGESLFKIVSVKDDIVVGLSASEMTELGGSDAGALAKAIASKGSLTLWQYSVQRAKDGVLQQAPLRKVGVLAASSLRVEPYTTPYKIVPHE